MKTTLTLTLLAATVAAAHASLVLTIDNPVNFVTRPLTGKTTIAITGSVSTMNSDYSAIGNGMSYPFLYDDSAALQYEGVGPDFTSLYTTGSYTGVLAYLDVTSDTPAGEYRYIGSTGGNQLSEIDFTFTYRNTDQITNIFSNYSVIVTEPVPEPASLAALGLGGLAILRRRKRA